MLKKETLSTLEWLRDVHSQMLKDLDEKYNGKSMLEIKENGKKALEESIDALNDVLCELRMMPEHDGWIPVVERRASTEEINQMAHRYEMSPDDLDGSWIYDCKLPQTNQDVLITTKYGIVLTTFIDDDYGMSFEGYEDEGDVLAWMPLPEPFKKEET